MVALVALWPKSYVLDQPFKYRTSTKRTQDSVHLFSIQMVRLSGIQMVFENGPFSIYGPFATDLVFRSPLISYSKYYISFFYTSGPRRW